MDEKNCRIFLPGNYYHIFNRGNNHEKIFYSHSNYIFFLKRYDYYLSPFFKTIAYCLLPNHFHLLVQIKEYDVNSLNNAIRNFFVSYSKAINKQEERYGSLFQKPYKRKLITSENYLTNVIYYIHSNPIHHNICRALESYPYSSYNGFLLERKTKLEKELVLKLFGSKDDFIKYHKEICTVSVEDMDFIIE